MRRLPSGRPGAISFAPAALAFLIAACGPSETDPGPGGVTVSEAKALDEAAEMLERQRLDVSGETPPATPATPAPTPSP